MSENVMSGNKSGTKHCISRRAFTKIGVLAGVGTSVVSHSTVAASVAIPSRLRGYEKLYREDTRAAAVEWFRNAKYAASVAFVMSEED